MKRICNVICDITSGGVESVIQNYFAYMDTSDYQLDLITYDVKSEICAKRFEELGFNIKVVPPKRDGFLKSVGAMNHAIKEGRYDIVHTHLTEWNCIPMFLAWMNRVPLRISHSHMAAFHKGIKARFLFAIQKVTNKIFANRLCACGDDAAKYLYGNRDLEIGRVTVLNNAIDVNRFQYNLDVRKIVRQELGIGNALCIGHIGRFLPQKNHVFLIDIFEQVKRIENNAVLILLGTGELEPTIREKVKALRLENSVIFLGIKGQPERYYQAMDVFCLPSLFEGLPVVGIEAQAAGLPCLVSDMVSDKVQITDKLQFCSLGFSAQGWAKEIIQLAQNDDRSVSTFPVSYDINNMAKEWEQLYA